LLFVGRAFDPQFTIAVPARLQVGVVAFFDVGAFVVLFDVGVDVGHIESHHLAQAGDPLAEVAHAGGQQGLQHGLLQQVLLLTQPASTGDSFAHVKAVGQVTIEDRPEAQDQDEERMLEQKTAQLGAGG
jgi:hypothetical protein